MDPAAPAHPWLKHYPPEVDWAAPLHAKPVFALLEESAALFPDHDCIEFQDRRFTYAEVKELSDRAAKGLIDVGSSRVDLQACKLEYSIVSPK